MESCENEYQCEKCGHKLLKSNKLMHDLFCQSSKNNNQNNINISNNHNNNNNQNTNYNFFNYNYFDFFTCEICGALLNIKDKADHFLCHELEQDEKKKNIERNNDFNLNNSYSDNDSEGINFNNIRRNINSNRNTNININILRNSIDDENEADDNVLDDDDEFMDDDYDDDGLDDDIIQAYQSIKIKDINKLAEDKRKCTICLEDYKNNDDSIILPCIHIFHSECIRKWMKKKNICPICKSKINSKNNNLNDDFDY